MDKQFEIGDVVQLKSGGPKMTVAGIEEDGVYCEWFSGSDRNAGSFHAQSLKGMEDRIEGSDFKAFRGR